MNKAILVGRLTRDPELRTTGSGVSVCSFTVAVNRRFKNVEGGYDADFINCVAWRQQAEFVSKYFSKGRMIGLCGSIQTRNYDKDGQRVYVTEVVADEVSFVESKSQGDSSGMSTPAVNNSNTNSFGADDGFIPMPADDDLPF